jgi:oxygen-independent coproporphyrinogen III oxidase
VNSDADRPGSGDFSSSGDGGCLVAPDALYIHVPVCASKCSYCDFYSLPRASISGDFEERLISKTLERAFFLADRFNADGFTTVYIGGGTPTMLSDAALERLLAGVEDLAKDSKGNAPDEWTVEANPDSLDSRKLDIMASHGVSRLSIGVQSLERVDLGLLGRKHGVDDALQAIRAAAERGMTVSADLIAGIPSRKAAGKKARQAGKLSSAAEKLSDAGASHLSVYDLSIEDGTALAKNRTELSFPDEDEEWIERQNLEKTIVKLGMRRYEVSNYSAPGNECLHNLAYWHMDSYIGAGPGAVSTIISRDGASLRIEEKKSLENYGEAGLYASEERIEPKDAAFETIMMAFRTSFGLDLDCFQERFGMKAEKIIGSTLESWGPWIMPGEPWPHSRKKHENNDIAPRPTGLALNGAGLDILNRFLGDCLLEMDRSFFL